MRKSVVPVAPVSNIEPMPEAMEAPAGSVLLASIATPAELPITPPLATMLAPVLIPPPPGLDFSCRFRHFFQSSPAEVGSLRELRAHRFPSRHLRARLHQRLRLSQPPNLPLPCCSRQDSAAFCSSRDGVKNFRWRSEYVRLRNASAQSGSICPDTRRDR
jgi:hypothetical protein